MAWAESGLFVSNLIDLLSVTTAPKWLLGTNKISLYNNTAAPDFTVVSASAIYTATNEVNGTGWAAGGVLSSAAAAGATALTPTMTQSPTKSVMGDFTNDLSVASTTLAAAYGAYIYVDSLSPKAAIMGLYFGGLGYATTAGTFAITFNVLGVWVIKCVPSGA